jgi:hypothetical protein
MPEIFHDSPTEAILKRSVDQPLSNLGVEFNWMFVDFLSTDCELSTTGDLDGFWGVFSRKPSCILFEPCIIKYITPIIRVIFLSQF